MTYTRPENGNKVNVFEIDKNAENIKILDETQIQLPNTQFKDESIKKYVVVEEHKQEGIVSVDYLYGKVDFEELSTHPTALKECMEKVITRKNIDNKLQKCCGALPLLSVNNGLLVINDDIITIKEVMRDVLKSSHRQVEKLYNDTNDSPPPTESLYKQFKRMNERDKIRRKEKGSFFSRMFGENQEEVIEEKPLAKDAELDTNGNLICFFNTGMVIKEEEQILRYSIFERNKDRKTSELYSILMSDVEEQELKYEGNYRDKFVNQICAEILNGAGEGGLEALSWKWPYVGKFSPESKIGVAEATENQDFFSKISGVHRDKDIDDDTRVL